jgi:hypothetical protein
MAKLTNIAAGALIAVGAAYAGVKGYAHWRVSSQLQEVARLASPYAELRWDGISTELRGSIEVNGLTISPRLIPEDIQIESVRLETGDPRLLLSGLPRRTSDAPEKVRVAVRGVRVPLSGSLLDSLQQSQGGKRPDACGPAGMPGPAMFAAMGVPALELDMGADLEVPKGEGRMKLAFDYATRGFDQLTASMTIDGVDRGLPSLRDATLRYVPNAETYARMIDHCARQRGSDRTAYLRALVGESDGAFVESFGMAPGPGLRAAIARYLEQPGELKIVLRPDGDLILTPNARHSLQYWVEVAGLALYVNGQLVEDLSVVAPDRAATRLSADARGLDGGAPRAEAGGTAGGAVSLQERPVSEIAKYLDYRVRVHTRDGKPPREGRLKSVDGQQADVDQRHSGGHLVAHVRLEQITRLEVYTR